MALRKSFHARVDNQGRMTIPKPIRTVLGIKHSSLVDAWLKNSKYFHAWVDCQGRITAPSRLRKFLGMEHGDIVECEVELAQKDS